MKRILLLLLPLTVFATESQAKVLLPNLFSDNMVLQQCSQTTIWGYATGKQITLKTSWSDESLTAPVQDGKWSLRLPTPKGSYQPHTLSFRDENSETSLNNVLIGEVWICSGQSNMEMTLRGFSQQPVAGAMQAVMEASRYRNRIHMLQVGRKEADTPRSSFRGRWVVSTPETALTTSATAYYFARTLADVLDVPIGIITTSRSSAKIEAWMSQEILAQKFGYDVQKINADPNIRGISKCGLLYNGMLVPLFGFPARGFLWYQGESNRDNPEIYPQLMQEMVADWRKQWNDTENDMPFIYVQIAPYAYENNALGLDAPRVVEAQSKALTLIPNSAMVVTTDIGEEKCIHPSRKDIIGKRAASEALRIAYGIQIPDASGIRMKKVEFAGGKALVSFENASYGLLPVDENLTGFEIAGADRVFYPAEAHILRAKPTVMVSSPHVPEPVAVRYAFRNYTPSNLRNTLGWPAYPFRTDDWPSDTK